MSTLDGGRTVGRYRIDRFLGAGAMGEVYLAEDPQIERRLAIKTVRLTGRPQEIEDRKKRLLREARAAGRLLHPNVVTLFDTGEADGLLYLAFEYVEGCDLSTRVGATPPLTLREVLRIGRQAADALDYAHRQGIVHRDIKPSNILLDTAGRVKVADFGIAKVAGQNTELTVAGSVMGSPQYLSPEQIRGEELDGRSDLFSLGVVLFELLAAKRPFDGETITTLVYQILHQEPPQISELRGGIPPRLERLLGRMLAKDREERLSSADQVAEELAAIERELPDETLAAPALTDAQRQVPTQLLPPRTTAAVSPGPAAPAAPAAGVLPPAGSRSNLGLFVALGLLALLVMAGGLAGGWYFLHRPPAAPQDLNAAGSPAVSAPVAPPPATAGGPPAAGTAASPAPAERPGPAGSPATPPAAQASSAGAGAAQKKEPAGRAAQVEPPPWSPPPPGPAAAPGRGPRQERAPVPTPAAAGPAKREPAPAASADARQADGEPEAEPEEKVDRHLKTGLDLAFRVTPPDAMVLVDGTVVGRADEWSGQKGSRAYTLASPGSHVIKLKAQGMKELKIGVEASAGGGTTPIPVRLEASAAADVDTSDLVSYRVREGIVLRVEPPTAQVLVDGKVVGTAQQFAGGFGHGKDFLALAMGTHRVSLLAPGRQRRDFAVQVSGGAEKDREKVAVTLAPGGAGGG